MPIALETVVNLGKKCDPVGRCIYCGSTEGDGPLGLEHVIPFALAGRLELPKASCDACARIINSGFESEYLSHEIIDVRALLRLPTRSSKKKNGRAAPHERDGRVGIFDRIGAFERWQYVKRDDFPFALFFPKYETPAFVARRAPVAGLILLGTDVYFAPDYRSKVARVKGAASVRTFTPSVLARQIAKIAHGIVVAELGLDGFDPFLVPLILGKDDLLDNYFGGTDVRLPSSDLHAATIIRRPDGVLLVRVCLFASLNAPSFLVVAGRVREPDGGRADVA